MQIELSPLHQWARFYASLGWHIFPLVPGTKSPYKDSHGSKEATCDLAQVDAWWRANPNANIAIRPSAANLYVYDVDPRNGGDTSHAQLQAQHGPIDSPLRVISPGGGFHLYMAAQPGMRYSGEPAQGIDGKFNGYAVLPPSIHPNGKRYEWAGGMPGAAVASPVPQWLERGQREERRQVAAREGSLADLELIRKALADRDPGDYHSWVFAIASVKHWEDHTPDAGTAGYELLREWSEQDPRHDDGQFDDKWNTFDSFAEGARTLGSLLHEAGLTREQLEPTAAEAFASPAVMPEPPRPLVWTSAPVDGFKGASDAATVQAELLTANARNYGARWQAGDVHTLIDDVAWRSGGNCEVVLGVLLSNPLVVDSEHLRAMIAHNCAHRTTWYTVGALTPEQKATAEAGLCAEIEVDDGRLVSAFRACLRALPAIGGVFQRNGALVWVDARGRIGQYDIHSLSHVLEVHLRFVKGAKGLPTKCPESLARRILGHNEFPGVQEITAAIPLPTCRADGTVIVTPGPDPQTGLFLLKGAEREPRVLNEQELREVVARIWTPFAEFPFDGPASRAVLLSALLTSVCRAALPTAPAFLVNAQAAGTGKTKLSECLMVAAAADKAALTLPSEPAEQAKTLIAALLEGPRGIMFDNVVGVLKASSEFCSAMTSGVYKARGLGGLAMMAVTNRALWVLNGNNVGLRGDAVRRVLSIGLDSPEDAVTRSHSFDPVEVVSYNLETFRADLLDVLVTYKAAGMPQVFGGGLASFEGWNRLVRGCVGWLIGCALVPVEMADPMQVMLDAQEDDPEASMLRRMLAAWHQRFGCLPQYLRDVPASPFDPAQHELWAEAYDDVTNFHGRHDPKRLGYWLRGVQKRKVDGMMFVSEKGRAGTLRWRIDLV